MKQLINWTWILCMMICIVSCNEDETPIEEPEATNESYHFLASIEGAYYLASSESLTEGSLSFINNGTQLDADIAARVISADGYLYSLDYGTGLLSQLKRSASGSYDRVKEINVGLSIGSNTPRYKLADENTILVYNVVPTAVLNDNEEVTDYTCTLRLSVLSIPDLTISNLTEFVIPQTENARQGATIGYHPMRVDAPVISGDKIYFGIMHTDIYDPTVPPPFRKPKQSGLETLVFDYPAMTNGTIVESNAAGGHTGGYRAPSMHVDEQGDVFQSNWFMAANGFDLSNGDKTVITRLRNGEYDDSYVFDVSEALGLDTNIATVGWFYVGSGIAYMPIQLEDAGNYYSENSWGLARIDLVNQTAVKLNVPNARLFAYENGVVANDKFYMAISPLGESAFVYEFDPASTSADGFVQGLALDGGDVQIEGIY